MIDPISRRVTGPSTRRVTTIAQPLAFMPMLRIGDTGGGTTVDESESIAGAGLPGLIFAGGGLFAWWRRKRKSVTLSAAN